MPLHLSGRDRGGNDAKVVFQGRHTNLHSVWDGRILHRRIEEDFQGNIEFYQEYLIDRVDEVVDDDIGSCGGNGIFSGGFPKSDICPEIWAVSINRLNCEYVWKGYKENIELGEDYYVQATGVIEDSLLLAGVRLANALNVLLERRL